MSEKFDWSKALDLSLSALGKSSSIWIKGGLVTFAVVVIGWSLWNTFHPKATKTTQQTADKIDNYYNNPKATFGCTAVKMYMKGNSTKE